MACPTFEPCLGGDTEGGGVGVEGVCVWVVCVATAGRW